MGSAATKQQIDSTGVTIASADSLGRMHAKGRISDSVTPIITLANKVAKWVSRCMLHDGDPPARTATVAYFRSTVVHCRTLQNFSSMVDIIAGLNY